MRSRQRRAHLVAWLLAASELIGAAAAHAQSSEHLADSRFIEHRERFTSDGAAPIDLRLLITPEAAAQTARVASAARAAITMLSGWFGALSPPALTVVGARWPPTADATGAITVPLRWLTSDRDHAAERTLIEGLIRRYWTGAGATAFERALILFISSRAIHHQLEGRNFATLRFFGGMVPLPLRAVVLSPPMANPRPRAFRFDEPDRPVDAEVEQGVRAMQTLERHFGWPMLLASLAKMRAAGPPYDAAALGAALSEARGTDVRFLVAECFRADAVFDYALAGMHSRATSSGLVETTVTIVRLGPAIFTARAAGDGGHALMPVRARFADGGEARDHFDGAAPSTTLLYTASAPAVSATVDPELMLLLDVNRENNAMVREARRAPLGIRLALNWIAWLQNTMLSYTAIL